MSICYVNLRFLLKRNASTLSRSLIELDRDVYEGIEKNKFKPRKHPGVVQQSMCSLPAKFLQAIELVTESTPHKQLASEAAAFSKFLMSRHEPPEEKYISTKLSEFSAEVKNSMNVDFENLDEDQRIYYERIVRSKVDKLMGQRIYNWCKIDYTRHQGFIYLFARAPQEYAVLNQIFKQLSSTGFEPKSMFDFGTGIGTSVWVAYDLWKNSLKEVFTVDSSSEMNDLSDEIYRQTIEKQFKNRIYQRQFLPASLKDHYDLVTCAYSLLELPSQSSRLETVLNLWQKTKKYLVLVEQGTNASFRVLNEARSFILSLKDTENPIPCHIFAPCPHEFPCPKMSHDPPICSFQTKYSNNFFNPKIIRENYSYVIFSKEKRPDDDKQWPRVISPVLVRSKHAVCRVCTKDGELKEVIASHGKHGITTHHCVRSTSWGDLLPVKLKS